MTRQAQQALGLKAIVPWYGGKRAMGPIIVEELGPHRSFWDVFCGSMAVLFAKLPSGHEHVVDLHSDVINLARVLQDEDLAAKLYSKSYRTLYHEGIFRESEAVFRGEDPPAGDQPNLDRAYHFLVASWMGRNGVAGTKRVNRTFAVRWTPGGGGGGTRWAAAADSIPAWHERLRRVTVICRDVFEVIGSIEDCDGVAIYADPPYILASRSHACRYEYEFSEADHRRLAEALARFRKARVVVSYYADPQLADLYPEPWMHRSVPRNKNLHVQNRRGAEATVAPEVLILNGPSFAARKQSTLF